jgi:hypothetical protein
VIEVKEHRVMFTEVAETIQTQQAFDIHCHGTTKASQSVIPTRVKTRSWVQLE